MREQPVVHVRVSVTLRKSILDPQGKAVEHGIHSLGYASVANVRIGKLIELDIDVDNEMEARRLAEEVTRKLLANPVMEDFQVVVGTPAHTTAEHG